MPENEKQENKPKKFSVTIKEEKFVTLINDTLGDKNTAKTFVADISTLVGNNYQLSKCTTNSIICAGLTAQTLKLSLAPTLGFCYLVPYMSKDYMVAQFMIGWKGLVQLAIRTGQYERIGVRPVHEGEYKGQDEFGEDEFKFDHKFDLKPTVGYYAYLKLINGFKKTVYWTKEQCEAHATKYSKAHQGKNKGGEYDNWTKMFDEMAMKTVLKQLISKWGVMSVELENAILKDQAVIDGKEVSYVDNDSTITKLDEEQEVVDIVKDEDINKEFDWLNDQE